MSRRRAACAAGLGLALGLALSSCGKVPIVDVNAAFTLADVSWFAEEETLFVFYRVSAEQGIGDPSLVELSYATDTERVDWTPLSEIAPVHGHEPVDCGVNARCGSMSLHVPLEPREVALRLRYHRDGELALDAPTVFNVVGPGDPHSHRSYVVYGVFDETNQRVQWRGRHHFPTLRNEEATELGLRRWLQVEQETYGTADFGSRRNPYAYGETCPRSFDDAGLGAVETFERAVFDEEDLPLAASEHSAVCAAATVIDATGTFTTNAVARKNPETRPAFPELRSPIRDATPLPFFLAPCERTISDEHEALQRQRLQIGDLPALCTDDWEAPGFVEALAAAFSDAVEEARPDGDDMVLVVGVHQDEDGVSDAVQEALALVAPEERLRASPRLAGAFVFDSDGDGLTYDGLERSTLWCPTEAATANAANVTCALLPVDTEVELGPLSFDVLPVFPTREQYLEFIDTYSERQAGEITALSFRTPEFATTSDHADLGDYAVATFLNGEQISAEPDDAFSYCAGDEAFIALFRSDVLQSEAFLALVAQGCADGSIPEDVCAFAEAGALPIQLLPEWHASTPEASYDIGLAWDFPFLLHVDYEASVAGAVTAMGFTVPFGIGAEGETYLGSAMWTTSVFSLEEQLLQCTRWCDHPTFDSAGVYQVGQAFNEAYLSSCYRPDYPAPGDSGFPLDP